MPRSSYGIHKKRKGQLLHEPSIEAESSHIVAMAQDIQECASPLFRPLKLKHLDEVAVCVKFNVIHCNPDFVDEVCARCRASVGAEEPTERGNSLKVVFKEKNPGVCTERQRTSIEEVLACLHETRQVRRGEERHDIVLHVEVRRD